MVVMKEVNSTDGFWTLSDLVRAQIDKERPLLHVWHTLGFFAYMLTTGLQPHNGIQPTFDSIAEGLGHLAVTNLKKTIGGGGSSDNRNILAYAKDNAEFLRKELAIFAPHIVLCCGTFDMLIEALGWSCSKLSSSGAPYAEVDGVVYVGLPHPGTRVSLPVLYSYFRETMLDLVSKGLIKP